MKKTSFIIIASLAILSSACEVLDKKPLNIINDGFVWEDQSLIDAYLANMYYSNCVAVNETPVTFDWTEENFWKGPGCGWAFINEMADEGVCLWNFHTDMVKTWKSGAISASNVPIYLDWWDNGYKLIREANYFMESLSKSEGLDEAYISQRMAEARFIRAFNYFALVKRYGGVPLITKTQSLDDPKEILYPMRDKEQAIYDFILSECELCAEDLPGKSLDADLGRATKYAALSLRCRAALYAASIAEFGEVKLDGLVGIPAESASKYYQIAYDAADEIIREGGFGLYDKNADKTQNFKDIFLDEGNKETIWAVRHTGSTRNASFWSYDFVQCPKNAWGGGNKDMPYLEFVEEFEHIDGTPGKFDATVFDGRLWTLEDLLANRDPRLFATVYTQGTIFQGKMIDYHKGLIRPDGKIQDDTGSYEGVMTRGNYGVDGSMGSSFGVMKYLNPSNDNNLWTNESSTDYIVFRYAETLLNFAEAALQLGYDGEALEKVNLIRERAGIAPLTSIDHKAIEHERKVELAFEGHRYWDARRWRVAADELKGDRHGLQFILDYNTRNYKIKKVPVSSGSFTLRFPESNYYLPIGLARIGINDNLVENPGY